ncbi:MAG: glucose-6-phosphate dehydrogenase, partial [Nanoarchaeota archaeon]
MDSFALIIFGITGNLAQIKLIPALYDMEEKGLLPLGMTIAGIARREMTDRELQAYVHQVLQLDNIHHQHEIKESVFKALCKRLKYISGDIQDQKLYEKLKDYLKHDNRIYYLATYPDLYHYIFENLQKQRLNIQNKGWVRLMIEKPIGSDLPSAKALNELLLKYFTENQIYRLDHYLGKETLQNILTFRFSNDIFEPLVNKDYIDHIQITASEDFGIGRRGGYYDVVGALKDVGQNHQLQMLAFSTMDAPTEFTNEAVTKERIKILKALVPLPDKVVYGQYQGYRKDENVSPDSNTDTFYALKTYIDSERFKEVPIYI